MDSQRITKLYGKRFDPQEIKKKNRLWKVLCDEFFQKFIPEYSIVLDIGAGYCEFINNIKAGKKYVIDMNPDVYNYANSDIEIHNSAANDINFLKDDSIDVIFISNFFEHLKNKEEMLEILSGIYRVCKTGGTILILQPNIRYAYKQYWDFFDHQLPLSDKSLAEALTMVGFKIDKVFSRFLPFTTKSKLPQTGLVIKIYLKLPFIWHIFGQQTFVIAKKLP